MLRALFISAVILLSSVMVQAQTIIYLPNNVGGGPAIIQDESDPAPPDYTAAADQDCAQQIIDADPFCLETNWDGICQDAYIECFLANCPDVIVLLPIELGDGPAILICGGDPVPPGYVAASDQDCAQEVVDENPECLDFVWDGPCQVAYNNCQGIPPTCDDGLLNGEEIGVDCGGPDCPECDFLIMGQMPDSVATCSTTIFDNGFMGNYANNSDDVLTVCSDTPGECIQAVFTFFQVENIIFDQLDVYAGSSMDDPLIGSYGGGAPPPDLINVGTECLTFHFTSDGSVTPAGFEIEISCVCPTCDDGILNGQEIDTDCGGPDCPACDFNVISEEILVTSCDAQLFDTGINGDYQNNEDYTMTFCTDGSGSCLQLDFTDIDIAFDDHLYIYDGPTTDGVLLADLTNIQSQETIVAPQGCVTFNFTSNGFATAGGFDIAISCTDVCPTCDDGVQNGYEIGVDCGGPDCPECPFIIMGGDQTETTCSTTIFDNGFNGTYSANSNDVLTICSENPGECVQAEFISFDIEGEPWDTFTVYAGPDTDSPVIGVYGDTDPPQFINVGTECLTFQFISDASVQLAGYEIEITCVCPTCDDGIQNGEELGVDCGGPDCPECPFIIMGGDQTESTCETVVYDNGYEGDYSNNSNDVLTLCSDVPGECIQLDFLSFDIEQGFDNLIIYAGDDVTAPVFGSYTGTNSPGIVNPGTECVTVQFTSDGSVIDPGYEFEVSCVCPTCDDGILNGQEVAVDCGGPDCDPCDFYVISEEVDVTTCDATLYDSGIEGQYSNNENYTMTFCSPDEEDCLLIEFLDVNIGFGDHLYVFDGEGTGGFELADISGATSAADIVVPSGCVTFQFTSDGFGTSDGFLLDISCTDQCPTCDDGIQNGYELGVDCGAPGCDDCDFILISQEVDITACSGSVLDSGGNTGDYENNEDYTMTICSEDSLSCLVLDFTQFEVENFFDQLTIYEGFEATGTPIQSFTGNIGPFTYEAPASCITLNFDTDGSVTDPGFQFNISCGECPQPTEQDCLGANVVCNEVYVQEDYPPEVGNFPTTLPPGTCLDNADNAIWYTFTVQESGLLSFILTPQVEEDDYDWGLFDLSDATCADISNDLSLLVSCNSYGEFGVNGPTGISTANGGTGNTNGPGNLNGPPFNADYAVTAGQTFALLVQNWTGSNDGYTLDFSESTAELFEPLGPDLEDVDFINCGNLIVTFETDVDCNTLDVGDFLIESDDQVYTVDSIQSECGAVGEVNVVELFISPAFPDVPDSISISFNPGTGVVQDVCGNPVPTDTVYDFVTPQWIVVETSVVNTICDFPLGSIEIEEISGGVPPYIVSFDGEETSDTLFTELIAGTYNIEVTDDIGCHSLVQIAVVSEFLNSELDTVIFENCGSIILEFSELVDCSTITAEGITISSASQVFNVVSLENDCADGAGQTFELSISPLFPDFPDTVNISFGSSILDLCGDAVPVEPSYEFITPQWISIATNIEKTECLSDIGSVELLQVFGAEEPFTLTFEGETVDEGFFIDQLGLGAYAIEITDSIGCHLLQNAFVTTDSTDVDVLIPNVFTPNGDDVNPLFGPFSIQRSDEVNLGLVEVGTYFDVYELQVFNRWGRLVFESGTTKRFWDGEEEGGDAAEGTYYYVLKFKEACAIDQMEVRVEKGYVTLVR